MNTGKLALLSATLLLLTSCGEHSFLNEIFGGVSSSSYENSTISSSSVIDDESEEGDLNAENGAVDLGEEDGEEGVYTSGVVGPLLQTQWWMRTPYIDMAPEQSRIGCGGVATAQLMRYHKHPVRGIGQSEPYTTGHGVNVPSVNFDEAYFDWDNTLNRYTNSNPGTEQQRKAIAEIYYYMGVGIKLNFGRNGEGGGFGTTDIIAGLTTFFGYDKSILLLDRSYYDDAEWEAIIKAQLNAGLPIFYHGRNQEKTYDHAFIIDGYDNNGKFHINWGWSGTYDGWYSLNEFNPGEHNLNYHQRMIVNIKPDAGGVFPNYEIALDNFSIQKTTVIHNERFEVYTYMRNVNNVSTRFLGGQVGVALVDNNNGIVAIIGTSNMGEGSLWSRLEDRPINCSVPETVNAGQYQLRIVTRPTGEEWRIATMSIDGVPTSIDFEVR